VAKQPSARDTVPEDDRRVAPDPLAAVLPAIAALGTIASIAAVNWAAADAPSARARSKRKPAAALRDFESNCIGLRDIFRRLGRMLGERSADAVPSSLPLKFGVHGRTVTVAQFSAYQQLVNDIASSLVLSTQNSFDVMCAIEDGAIEPPEALYFAFGEQQERLNKLLVDRASLKAAVDTGREVADALSALVGELKSYHRV